MFDPSRIIQKFLELKCCVVIPTYNNDHTIRSVVEEVLIYTDQIIVVNDGSTDTTPEILSEFSKIKVINIPKNIGKGWAIRQGFKEAIISGFRYAITIDSDGQHFPADIPAFLEIIEQNPDVMVIGARDMTQQGVPGTSHFGHQFSIFWFKVETGISLPDIQSGYRLYPLDEVAKFKHVFSRKYEYEVEILVRLAWLGVQILSVPVKVYYAPKEIRVSHFRKFWDFARVSVANTILVFIGLLWARPLLLFKSFRKKSLREIFIEQIINSKESNARLSASVALGLFIGVMPIWGWQMITAFGLAHVLKLNRFVAVASSNISIPPLLPLIIFFSYLAGGWILDMNTSNLAYNSGWSLQWFKENLLQYLVGSMVLGVLLAITLGPIAYLLLNIFRKKNV